MNIDYVRQFKLSSGEEIICQVIEELEEEVYAKFVLRVAKYDISLSQTYYSFKPWMAYLDNTTENILISKYHIMGMAEPSEELLEQYVSYYDTIIKGEDSDGVNIISQLKEKNAHMSDSDFSNVISFSFTDRTKLH